MANILIVEDERTLAAALRQGLTDELHVVEVALDGDEGLWAARTGEHDLIVLDRMLPGTDGIDICRAVRKMGNDVGILMLTARTSVPDVVAGLDAGANDYLAKPFEFEELLARVRALLRSRARALTNEIRVGLLRVDTRAHRAWVGEHELTLTAQELKLLEYLASHEGQIVSRQRLTAALWSHDDDPESNVLEVLVASLRRKLESGGRRRLIHTVRGAGYVLREATS